MSLLVLAIVFVLVWSALIWGIATSDSRSDKAYTEWPDYWRTNILVAVIPVLFVFVYTAMPVGWKPEFSVLQSLTIAAQPAQPELLFRPVAAPQPDVTHQAVLALMIQIVIWAYVAGAAIFLTRFCFGKIRTVSIVKDATYDKDQGIWVTDRKMSPFTVAGRNTKIIFPKHLLDELSSAQLQLVIRHEQAHLDHRDPQWADVFHLVKTVFWFSPFIRDLIKRWQLAVELRSDTVALAGQPAAVRKSYAESLITAIRLTVEEAPCSAASFSDKHLRSEKKRIKNIINGENHMQNNFKNTLRLMLAASALGVIGCASAAGVSTAAADPAEEVHKERKVHIVAHADSHHDGEPLVEKKVKVVRMIDGERVELGYEDLSDEEKAEIDRELARAEVELERAMAEIDAEMLELDGAETELERAIKIELIRAEEEMERAREEIEESRIEIEVIRKELHEKHEAIEREREERDNEDN